MRSLVALLAVALLAATPVPVPPVSTPPPSTSSGTSEDRARSLIGSWTCRSPRGELQTLVFRADGDGFTAQGTPRDPNARKPPLEHFAPDGKGGWQLSTDLGPGRGFLATAPAWSETSWTFDGNLTSSPPIYRASSIPQRITYERIDASTMKRLVSYGPSYRIAGGEVCARGEAPPAAGLCAVSEAPASVVQAVMPDAPAIAQMQGITGAVHVLVSLDPQGQITNAVVRSSPSVLLNSAALASAKQSKYLPALHDCIPVASQYEYTVEFSSR